MNFQELKDAKILVTGTSGFIGKNLSEKLVGIGAKVFGVSRKDQTEATGIEWFKGDLSQNDFVTTLFEEVQPDYVIHLASHVLGARAIEYVFSTFRDNLVTSLNIMSAVQQFKCKRLVLAGSFEEGDSKTPSSPYAATKIAVSNYARMFYKLYGTPICTAALYMVYGPGQVDRTKLIPYTILKSVKGESPELTSGVRMVDWIFVDDVTDGLLHMLVTPGIEGETIEIGTGKSVSIREIVDLTVQLVDPNITPVYGATKDRPMEQEKNANIEGTYKKIGWKPKTSLAEGLGQTIDYYRNHG